MRGNLCSFKNKEGVKLRRKPITEISNFGCSCSNIYTIFDKNEVVDGYGVHFYFLELDGKVYDINRYSINSFVKETGLDLNSYDLVEFKVETPLHDETYELNKVDMEFYLVEQGMGYA